MTRTRIIAGVVVALLVGGGVAGFAVAWRPAISAIEPPAPPSFDTALVRRGRDLAALGNCNDCHTVRGGKTFAGGLAVPTPFGTIYSSNITPDADTGIGRWPEMAFRRAMRSGVDRDGAHLYPTFPYDHFTNVTDEDDRALYAYLMTRPAVHAPTRANKLAFPLDQRFVVAGWKLLFLRRGTYQPDGTKSAEWNRGAYLVEGLAHCGACHTPRNALGAERVERVVCRRGRRQLERLRDQCAVAVAGAVEHRGAFQLSPPGLASRSRRGARTDGGSGPQPVVGG
jgi:mono/diheme cytochrome c family protein